VGRGISLPSREEPGEEAVVPPPQEIFQVFDNKVV